MAEQLTMTPQQARKTLLTFALAMFVILLALVALFVHGLMHPFEHRALLMLMGFGVGPALLVGIISKTGLRGMLESSAPGARQSIASEFRRHPAIVVVLPLILVSVTWGLLLGSLAVKKGGDTKLWVKNHIVLAILWMMTPQVAAAYFCIVLHAKYTGMYIASCLCYMTVSVAIRGLTLEGGVVRFFGTYKAQASPLVILCFALICCASFGVLHFAVCLSWPGEYANMHSMEDALYFSVVTMATVGYGDIFPIGHAARLLCVAEIVSGVLLLVVGMSASMTIWLQRNQSLKETETALRGEAPSLLVGELSEKIR